MHIWSILYYCSTFCILENGYKIVWLKLFLSILYTLNIVEYVLIHLTYVSLFCLSHGLFSDLMPSFIRHPTFLRREPPLVEPVPAGVSGAGPYSSSSVGDVSGPKSFLRNAPPRTALEISRRESHRLSAPPHLHRDYSPSSPSYISDAGSVTENGDGGPYYYPPEPYYNNQPRRAHRPDHFNESYRYYEHNELNYPRNPGQPQTPQPHSRPPPCE